MNSLPKELRYSPSHEWVNVEEGDIVTVGITEHAQHLLGDLVFVELPELQAQMAAGQEVAVVESVKTAADVFSPVSGSIIEINESLEQTPGMVNSDPYGNGWLFRMKVMVMDELNALLDAEQYQQLIEQSDES